KNHEINVIQDQLGQEKIQYENALKIDFELTKLLKEKDKQIEEQSKNNNNNLFKGYQNNCNIYLIFLVLAIILSLYNAIPVRWYTYSGDYYYNNEQYDKAIEYYEKELSIFKTNYKKIALLYNNLGHFYFNEYDKVIEYVKVIEYIEKALEIRLDISGINRSDVAKSYDDLGNYYFYCDQYNKSIENHEKALKIKLGIFGTNHSDVAMSYDSLGDCYNNNKQYDKAIGYHEKALKIRLNIFGTNDLRLL
ncbi:hypothetical protein RFI_34920, partial [Reticulomyxa filosa]